MAQIFRPDFRKPNFVVKGVAAEIGKTNVQYAVGQKLFSIISDVAQSGTVTEEHVAGFLNLASYVIPQCRSSYIVSTIMFRGILCQIVLKIRGL